jgi:Carboxypeptidase regulatory-like domain
MKFRSLAVLFALVGFFALTAWSQSTATLSGTVTDPSGAVVAGARVTVHSIATGEDRIVSTDSAGLYVVPSLVPGDYSIEVTATGFGPFKLEKMTVLVDQTATVNVRLTVSSAGETVQVESAVQQIEAQTITVGQVIDNTAVQELPLNGRHFLDMTVLTPGGVVADTAGSLTSASRGLGANSFLSAGNREDAVNFQINGINLNDMSQNQITFQPSISTTSEFKIDNQTFSAEYGRSSGEIVNVGTRSGSDRFHGEAFDYFRNEALDARNYFNRSYNPATGVALPAGTGDKAPLKRDNFGGSLGGPILKRHTFFFGSYEGLRQHQGILQNSPVFTSAERNYITSVGNPAALDILAVVQQPNSGNDFVGFTPGPVQIDQGTIDILQQLGAPDQLHGFYALQEDTRTEPALQGDTLPGWGDHRHAVRQIGTLNWTHIFSPSLVNEARFGFNRINIVFAPATLDNPSNFGLGTGVPGNVGLPFITFSDLGTSIGGPNSFPQGRFDTLGVVSDTATWLRGKHTVKFGGEGRRFLEASFTDDPGILTFATSTGDTAGQPTSANIFANGLASAYSQTPNDIVFRDYVNALGLFIQDNYKVTQNVTVEAGLRFEWNGTPVEAENRMILFIPSGPSLVQVGTNGYSEPYKQNFNLEPRVGFTDDVFGSGKTVLRGGFGLLTDQPVLTNVSGLSSNPPISKKVSFTGSSTTTIPVASLYSSALAAGLSVASTNPNFRNAYMETYNLNVQQAMPWGMVGSVGYYGSVGRHLRIATNENQSTGPQGTIPGSNPSASYASGRPYQALSASSPNDEGKSINSNITEANSTSASSYNAMWATLGKNFQHGLEFNMNYEWAKSMDLNSLGGQGGLTLEDSTNPPLNWGLSDYDVRQHYAGTAVYALPFHRNQLVAGYRLESIFQYQTGNPVNILASSDSFNGNAGEVRPNLVGHPVRAKMQIAGSSNVQLIQNPGGLTYGGSVCDLTNYTSSCIFEIQAQQFASLTGTPLSTSSTAPTVYNGDGAIARNSISGPGYADLDMSGEKQTKIWEGLAFTLRVDAFDILNHPNFGQPSGNVQSSIFGQITGTRFATSDGGSSRQLQISGKFTF